MTTAARCAICEQEESNAALLSPCFECGSWFHLNPYSNQEGIDCGDAVLGESLGVHFYCQRCLDEIDRQDREAMGGSPHARAAAMVESLFPGSLPVPPAWQPEAGPASAGLQGSDSQSNPPPARQRSAARRRYRRID